MASRRAHLVQHALHAAAQHRGQKVCLRQRRPQVVLSRVARQPGPGRQLHRRQGGLDYVGVKAPSHAALPQADTRQHSAAPTQDVKLPRSSPTQSLLPSTTHRCKPDMRFGLVHHPGAGVRLHAVKAWPLRQPGQGGQGVDRRDTWPEAVLLLECHSAGVPAAVIPTGLAKIAIHAARLGTVTTMYVPGLPARR